VFICARYIFRDFVCCYKAFCFSISESTSNKVFYVHGTVHRNSVSINIQQDATIHSLFYL